MTYVSEADLSSASDFTGSIGQASPFDNKSKERNRKVHIGGSHLPGLRHAPPPPRSTESPCLPTATLFVPTAKASNSFAIVNATYTYTGEGSSIPALVSIDFVTNDGKVVTSADSFAVAPDPALGMDELYTDGSVTGNTVLLIPEAADGNLRVTPGLLAKEIFVSIK